MVTLNRPERRNALSIALMTQLIAQLEALAEDGQTRVVILRGAGPVFCAGLDLAEAQDRDLVGQSARCVAQTLSTLRYSSLVTIAALQGGAYAGGAGVIAACDMAVGTTDCQIGFPEARRGLLPALISDVLRTKLREGDLSELFLVGEPITAQRAHAIGLLQRIVEPSQLLSEAQRLAAGVLAGGPQTIRDTKKLLHHCYGHHAPQADQASSSIDEHLKARFSAEAAEGLQAFLDKRPPAWMQ
ncbi:MAG: enoyl-CoA hydratase/isomerase family protein [Pirellulaceae bacterium]|nr:enoyl-CoA hydratase/isomerase family protein [Pirellulaceae bacterium]